VRAVGRKWWVIAALLLAGCALLIGSLLVGSVPLPEALPAVRTSQILAADGRVVGSLYGEENRTIVGLDQIAPELRDAVIAAEDRAFYRHSGVSPRGVLRAVFANVRGGRVEQGGSTITQQYVRNAFASVGKERTFYRKVKEALLAVKFERISTKDQILEYYLNTVYFGRGAYGAEAAARTYFNAPASQLNLSQAAYLAGAIRSPGRFQPDRSMQAAVTVRNIVLDAKRRYLDPGHGR
jgi:membrane peptidoglycan carboxypeptidase